jgi:hypothetical protein
MNKYIIYISIFIFGVMIGFFINNNIFYNNSYNDGFTKGYINGFNAGREFVYGQIIAYLNLSLNKNNSNYYRIWGYVYEKSGYINMSKIYNVTNKIVKINSLGE